MITVELNFNGEVSIKLTPETEDEVTLLNLATKNRVPVQIKDGDKASKVFVLGKREQGV